MNKTTVFKFLSFSGLMFGVAGVSSQAVAIDIEPGLYQSWRPANEVANLSVLGKATGSMCISATAAKQPLTLMGEYTADSGCTATAIQRTNSVTSVFNVTCNGGNGTGVATSVKNGQTFSTTIVWRGEGSVKKTFFYSSRLAACSN
jgi:Protein of unknown function (DUF3617)